MKRLKNFNDLHEGSKHSSNWSNEEKRKDKNDKNLKDLSFTKLIEEFENKLIAYHGISVGDQKTIDKIKKEILDRYSQK